jgi:hypothetical protein
VTPWASRFEVVGKLVAFELRVHLQDRKDLFDVEKVRPSK